MSVKVSTWAWELQCVKGMTKLVLMALADSADDDGFCWPKLDTIASKASTSRSTVKRAIKELSDLNLLSVEHRERENGASATNYYWVNVGHHPDLYIQDVEGVKMDPYRTSVEQTEVGGVQNEPGEGFTGEPGRGSIVNPHNEPSLKPSNNNPLSRHAGGTGEGVNDLDFEKLMAMDPADRAEAMRSAGLQAKDFGKTPREMGINPRALGTNQRAVQHNPRALGTNPRSLPGDLGPYWDRFCSTWALAGGDSFKRAEAAWLKLNVFEQEKAVKYAGRYQSAAKGNSRKTAARTYLGQHLWEGFERSGSAPVGKQRIFVVQDSPAWDAWREHLGRSSPVGRDPDTGKPGWWFDSLFPPGHTEDQRNAC